MEVKAEQAQQAAEQAERNFEEANTASEHAQQAVTALREQLGPLEGERQQADEAFRSNYTDLTAVHVCHSLCCSTWNCLD